MKFKRLLAAGMAAMMLAGCGGGTSASSDIKSPKFGFIGPLTGPNSQYGTAVKNALELAVEKYNDENDTNITIAAYDDKADASEAVNAYNKLIDDDKVTAILSPVTTGSSLAVASASQANNTPILSPSGTGDSITINTKTNKVYENVFRICTNDSYAGTYLAKLCKSDFKFSKVAVLYNKESDYSTGLRNSFVTEAKNQSVSVVYDGAYTNNTKDFSTFISKIKASGCDSVYLPDYYETVVSITKQLRDANINVPLFGGDGWDGVLGVKGVNVKNFENTYFVSGFDEDATDGVAKEFATLYKKKYNTSPNMFAAMEYDAVTVMMKAINAAGSTDAAAINEQLAKIEIKDSEAACGGFTYDENHNPVKEMVIKTIKNGKYVTQK